MSGSRPTDEPSSCSCRPLEDSESLIKHWSLVHPHICVRSQVGNYLGITKNGEFYLIPWIETLNFTTEDFKSDTKLQKMSSCTNLWIQLKVFSYGLWGFVNSGDFPSCSSSTFTWWETVDAVAVLIFVLKKMMVAQKVNMRLTAVMCFNVTVCMTQSKTVQQYTFNIIAISSLEKGLTQLWPNAKRSRRWAGLQIQTVIFLWLWHGLTHLFPPLLK